MRAEFGSLPVTLCESFVLIQKCDNTMIVWPNLNGTVSCSNLQQFTDMNEVFWTHIHARMKKYN